MPWLIPRARCGFSVRPLQARNTIKGWLMKQITPCLRAVNYVRTPVFKALRSIMWLSFSPKRNPKANLCLTWTRALTSGIPPYEFVLNMPSVGSNGIELLKTKSETGNLALRMPFLRPVAVFTISDWIIALGLINPFNFICLLISNRYNLYLSFPVVNEQHDC